MLVLVNIILWGRVNADCTHLDLVHKTAVDEVPSAIAPFQGRILVGVGRMLRLYDMGRKKLLRKCENKVKGHELYVVSFCNLFGKHAVLGTNDKCCHITGNPSHMNEDSEPV